MCKQLKLFQNIHFSFTYRIVMKMSLNWKNKSKSKDNRKLQKNINMWSKVYHQNFLMFEFCHTYLYFLAILIAFSSKLQNCQQNLIFKSCHMISAKTYQQKDILLRGRFYKDSDVGIHLNIFLVSHWLISMLTTTKKKPTRRTAIINQI